MWEILATILLVVSAAGCLVFVILYDRLTYWRRSSMGRNVMAMMSVAAILLTLALFRVWVPWVTEYLHVLRTIAFGAVTYIVWRRVWLLLRAQREQQNIDYGRDRDRKEETDHERNH